MKIIVCMKQVPDPEGPRDSYLIDREALEVEPKGIPPVLSPFDENALEAAMRLKDSDPGGMHVMLLCLGDRISSSFALKALAVGADEMVKVEDAVLEAGKMDSLSTARCLAMAIERIGDYDLILTGRQAADFNAGQTGIMLAGILGIPAITFVREIDLDGRTLTVRKALTDGYHIEKAELPALLMVNSDYGAMRYPSINRMREARKRPVTTWSAEDIGVDGGFARKLALKDLYAPEVAGRDCILIEAETPEGAGRELARRLKEDRVI